MSACWFTLLHLWRKIWLNTLIIHLDQIEKLHGCLERDGIKNKTKQPSVISNLDRSVEEYVLMAVGLKSGPTLILISLGPGLSLSSLYICLSFFLSFRGSHSNTHKQGCWSCPPLRSSNMQPGSWMIKAVAGGLHFETINRPPRAESNSKPSISVSPGPKWHRGRGCAEGERADSTSASSLYVVAKNVEQLWRNFGLSDVISSRHCGFIQLTSQPEGAAGGGGSKHWYSINNSLIVAAVLSMESKWQKGKHTRSLFTVVWISHLDCLGLWTFIFKQASSTAVRRMAKTVCRSTTSIHTEITGLPWNFIQTWFWEKWSIALGRMAMKIWYIWAFL